MPNEYTLTNDQQSDGTEPLPNTRQEPKKHTKLGEKEYKLILHLYDVSILSSTDIFTFSEATKSSTRKSFVSLAIVQFTLHPIHSPISLAFSGEIEIFFSRRDLY
jgi:hypothetical protein